MSAIIATFEHGVLMPSRTDDFFRYHNQERTEVDSDGDVESHVGHFTLREVDAQTIRDYVTEWGDPWVSEKRHLPPGWYIDVRGEDGTVWAFHYPDEANGEWARMDFAEAQRVYATWIEDDPS